MAHSAADLAIKHWNLTPLYYSEEERYGVYPWLYEAAEFTHHRNERVLEVGCGSGCDLLQFAKHGALATGVDITPKHLDLARQRVGNLATVLGSDGVNLPFPDASFDYVYSHGVAHARRPTPENGGGNLPSTPARRTVQCAGVRLYLLFHSLAFPPAWHELEAVA